MQNLIAPRRDSHVFLVSFEEFAARKFDSIVSVILVGTPLATTCVIACCYASKPCFSGAILAQL